MCLKKSLYAEWVTGGDYTTKVLKKNLPSNEDSLRTWVYWPLSPVTTWLIHSMVNGESPCFPLLPVLFIYCHLANDTQNLVSSNNKRLLSHSFCRSGIWAWLNWVTLDQGLSEVAGKLLARPVVSSECQRGDKKRRESASTPTYVVTGRSLSSDRLSHNTPADSIERMIRETKSKRVWERERMRERECTLKQEATVFLWSTLRGDIP